LLLELLAERGEVAEASSDAADELAAASAFEGGQLRAQCGGAAAEAVGCLV
jgi:hypothetical protein